LKTTPQSNEPMKNQLARAEQKLAMIMQHVTTGLAEIDRSGEIIHLNVKGEALLKPVLIATGINGNNLYPVLEHIAPAIAQKIKITPDDAGHILNNEPHSFSLSFGGEHIERHFNFTVIKMFTDCILVGFDDYTQKNQKDRAILELASDKAVMQGKFEIASNILHDIGNAIVGFGTYITRIKRSLEQNNPETLQKLADFFAAQQTTIAAALGEAKAGAAVKMLSGITESQKNSQEEIRKSVTEQLNIITHIQEILNIQRQYANGHESQERKPLNLRSIINDCMAMLFASIEKRGIKVSINIPESLPVINGDRTRLMQVILNVLKNGIEAIDIYAAEKSISLTVSTLDDLLILKIQDNGHGFDEATGEQIFERGFTTKASGSGLGLSSCRAIIENHDGAIHITSEGFGKGALTTIEFKI
jgi:signal transduction histidine kinase